VCSGCGRPWGGKTGLISTGEANQQRDEASRPKIAAHQATVRAQGAEKTGEGGALAGPMTAYVYDWKLLPILVVRQVQ
jgi:hypothetical protein